MQKEEIKFVASNLFEGMVSIRALIRAREAGVSDRRITNILYSKDRLSKIGKEVAYLRHEGERQGFSLTETNDEALEKITLGTTHGGLVAECTERTIPPLADACSTVEKNGFYVMLEGIEDPYNFGYALRSLYALGVSGVILPGRNWMTAAGVVCRASAGASECFSLYTATAEEAADFFAARGYTVVCADVKTEDALESTALPYPIFLIVGGEKRGISRAVLDKADKIIKISYGRDFSAALSAAIAYSSNLSPYT